MFSRLMTIGLLHSKNETRVYLFEHLKLPAWVKLPALTKLMSVCFFYKLTKVMDRHNERESSLLTAHQHKIGYLVPL